MEPLELFKALIDLDSMKRYVITENLRRAIRENSCSMRSMSQQLGFTVKNMLSNQSINEHHWQKLRDFLELDNLQLKPFEHDYAKNLGIHSFSQPIKNVKKSEDLAEFIGILLGDGCLCRNCIYVACDKRWNNYIEYLKVLFTQLFGVDFKVKIHPTKNVVYLYYYSKKLMEILLNLELERGDKIINNLGIPSWIKENPSFAKRCIRGLIDTDGNVHFCTRERRHYVGFTNLNKQLFQDFKDVTLQLGYSFAKANPRNVCLYRKDQVAHFIQTIQPRKAIRAGLLPRQ